MNRMSELAKLFDVDLGEEFEILENRDYTFRFTYEGLEFRKIGEPYWQKNYEHGFLFDLFTGLFTGKKKIKKTPWKPKYNENFYVPIFVPTSCEDGVLVWEETWTGINDLIAYNDGFVCKTREEAEELHNDIVQYARKLRGFDS